MTFSARCLRRRDVIAEQIDFHTDLLLAVVNSAAKYSSLHYTALQATGYAKLHSKSRPRRSAQLAYTPDQKDRHGICGAKKKSGEPCRNFAGLGTPHKGVGR